LDSTPLTLIAIYRYWEITRDNAFLVKVLPSVEQGLNWIITYGDLDKDSLLEYELPKNRKHGGLFVQSWTDSKETLLGKDGKLPMYPIAPVEVQGYAWLALKLWADFYADTALNSGKTDHFARKLEQYASSLKQHFNDAFIFESGETLFTAQALDGRKNQIRTVTGNALLLLWATFRKNGMRESILKDEYVPSLIKRAFQQDLFEEDAGIRTMSKRSRKYNPNKNSYHNGSFWPKLNGMAHEGLEHWDFTEEANRLRRASLKALSYFGSPIELYLKDEEGKYQEYFNDNKGQRGCRVQAWSAACALDLLTV
jgi:glycogen debranching enzyme